MVYVAQQSSSHQRWAIWHLQDLDTDTMCQVLQHKWLHPGICHQMDDNINDHCSRSNQGEGHPTNGLQGIQGCVFQKKKPTKLPPSWPYDHAIKLKDLFVFQWAKAYLLNSIEHQACKEFIEEYLKTGKISPSKSLQAMPFFFVKRKEAGKLCPCQDYQYLNSHTIKNT